VKGFSGMELVVLVLYLVFAATGFGWRSYAQWRRTGSTGVRGFHGRPGSLEWLAGLGFVVGVLIAVSAPVLQWVGVIAPLALLENVALHVVGALAAVCGVAATLWSQLTMGDSWRIGVDTAETTALVERGVFGLVRNPIFSAMLLFVAGAALMAPNPLALIGLAVLFVAIELQVRVVEEPYLLAVHGDTYRHYTHQVGRFVPGIGRAVSSIERRPMNTTARHELSKWPNTPVSTVLIASVVTAAILGLGYLAFGLITMLIFTAGFVGGLLLWFLLPSRGSWAGIKWPYWIALVLFLAHRVEENRMGFFPFLAEVTGEATPKVSSVPLLLLLALSVGAWLLVPVLMVRGLPFGRYLAWTFFASIGITELAHFVVFPWFRDSGVDYVPGMWTVIALPPVAWLGMWRLARGTSSKPDLIAATGSLT